MLVRFDGFELDEPCFEIRCGGRALPAQPKVLDLIFYLVRHRDRVVTKDELFDNVWRGVVVSEGSLSQAASIARKLLGDDPDSPRYIRTVRGRGLQFVAPVTAAAPLPGRRSAALDATSVSLAVDTAADPRGDRPHGRPHLFVALHGDDPGLGGARYDLGDTDEVDIGRGPRRDARRIEDPITRRLVLRIPGDAVSRAHARFVRTQAGFCVVDGGSKNGTAVNGGPIKRRVLHDRDVIECGRTFFLFRDALPTPPDLRQDAEGDARVIDDDVGSVVPDLQALGHVLDRIARTAVPVLVCGETGSGKEVVARAFHARSGRTGPFVAVSGGALSGGHAVRQLFGTGSGAGDAGLVRSCEGGTLLLDQVESLPLEAQGALVRTIEDRSVLPVGASRPVPVDVRVIAATTVDLDLAASAGTFRPDLLQRLAGFKYVLPPLRDRLGDFGVLVARVLKTLGVPRAAISPEASLVLLRHRYPGNLRELARNIENAFARAGARRIDLADLPAVS